MVAALDDEHLLAQLRGSLLGDGEAEEAGSNNDEVIRGHEVLFYRMSNCSAVLLVHFALLQLCADSFLSKLKWGID